MPDKPPPSPENGPLARRAFFRHFLMRGLDKAEDVGKKTVGKLNEAIAASGIETGPGERQTPAPAPAPATLKPRFLRPPGALPELEMAETCSRCGDCVRACPAQAIRLDPSRAGGLPHIVARVQPCVVCSDLSCMAVCPTGALQKLPAERLAMGLAGVDHARCLRGPFSPHPPKTVGGEPAESGNRPWFGEDCQLCVTSCPIGEKAIAIDADGRVEIRPGCVGCGVCERACPTEPASIVITNNSPTG